MKRFWLCLVTCMFAAGSSLAEGQVLYCTDEISTGFIKTDGEWKVTKFVLKRHTIKFDNSFKSVKFKDFNYDCSQSGEKNIISCIGYIGDRNNNPTLFSYNKLHQRYHWVSPILYSYVYNEIYSDTAAMTAGKCEKF